MTGGFKLDGVDASTYGITLLKDPDAPMIPGTRDRTAKVLGRAGEIYIDSVQESRVFSLDCAFKNCASPADLDNKIRTFAAALVDTDGRPKEMPLVFDETPTLTYTVKYAGNIPFARAWAGCSKFTLSLVAYDPYAYEAEETTTATVTTSPSTIPVTSTSVVKTPAKICIENTGATPVNGFTLKIYY